MALDLFLIDLIQTGQITVSRELSEVDEDTLGKSIVLLAAYHQADSLEMPATAPAFNPDAAIWAAKFIYNTIQFILIRDLEEAKIQQWLKDYDGEKDATAIYSADLMLRFLPDLFNFGSGLSPDDPLIYTLRSIASKWIFSTVGVDKLTTIDFSPILLNHPSLCIAYIDRIIDKKDFKRLKNPEEKNKLKEVLGMHQNQLWPTLDLIFNEEHI